jgi:altronate dehydratase small subunit
MTIDKALVMKEADNVATAVQNIAAGETVNLNLNGSLASVKMLDNIPFGHKFAIRDIADGEAVVKYGEIMGRAVKEIKTGQHAHVHNVESCRGRGDKK